jgi:hypothetical protein
VWQQGGTGQLSAFAVGFPSPKRSSCHFEEVSDSL